MVVTHEITWTISATVTRQGTKCELEGGDLPSARFRYASTTCEFTWTRKTRLWSVGQNPSLSGSQNMFCRVLDSFDGSGNCIPAADEDPPGSGCWSCGTNVCECPDCYGGIFILGTTDPLPSSCYCTVPGFDPVVTQYVCRRQWSSNSNYDCFLWNYDRSDEGICNSFAPKPFGTWLFKHIGTWTETFTGVLDGLASSPIPNAVQNNDVVTIICDKDCKNQDRPIFYFTPKTVGKKASWEWDSENHPCCPMPCNLGPQTCLESGTYSFDFQINPFSIIGNSECLNGTTFDGPITNDHLYPYMDPSHGYPLGNSPIYPANNPIYRLLSVNPLLDMCGFDTSGNKADPDCQPLDRFFEEYLCLYPNEPGAPVCKGYPSQQGHGLGNACIVNDNEPCCGFEKGAVDELNCVYPDQFVEHAATTINWSWTCV